MRKTENLNITIMCFGHLECQSTEKGTILIHVFECNTQIRVLGTPSLFNHNQSMLDDLIFFIKIYFINHPRMKEKGDQA